MTPTRPASERGDQFNVYVCDRFIAPALTPEQQKVGQGHLLLDRPTRDYIREQLSYRFPGLHDGQKR